MKVEFNQNTAGIVILSLLIGGAIGFVAAKHYFAKTYAGNMQGRGEFYRMMRDKDNIPDKWRYKTDQVPNESVTPPADLPDRSATQPE